MSGTDCLADLCESMVCFPLTTNTWRWKLPTFRFSIPRHLFPKSEWLLTSAMYRIPSMVCSEPLVSRCTPPQWKWSWAAVKFPGSPLMIAIVGGRSICTGKQSENREWGQAEYEACNLSVPHIFRAFQQRPVIVILCVRTQKGHHAYTSCKTEPVGNVSPPSPYWSQGGKTAKARWRQLKCTPIFLLREACLAPTLWSSFQILSNYNQVL